MASLSQLIVKITGDASDFTRAISAAQRQAATMAEKFEAAGSVLTRSLSLPLGALGGLALKQASDFESLRRGLEAVSGSSEKAAVQFERLKKVAELPGLGFKEAVQGAVNLQAAGFSAATAERALKAFGNALATVGKGRAELDGVVLALSQIQSKGKFSAEELNQLAERLPQIRVAIKQAFGTASTEDIQKLGLTSEQIIEKIITEFEKLPQVTGGLRNSFENLRDNAERALAAIGEAIAPFAASAIKALEPIIATIGAAGKAFAALPEPVKTATVAVIGFGVVAGPILKVAAAFKELEVVVLGSGLFRAAATALGFNAVAAGAEAAAKSVATATTAVRGLGVATATTALGGFFRTGATVAAASTPVIVEAAKTAGLSIAALGGAAVAAGAGVAGTLLVLDAYSNKVDTGSEATKRLRENLEKIPVTAKTAFAAIDAQLTRAVNSMKVAGGSGSSGIVDSLFDSVFSDVKAAGDKLSAAFATLGINSSASLRKELAAAQSALETIREAIKSGAADQNDYAAGLEKVRAIQEQLTGKIKETSVELRSIPFAEKSKENELFAASIARIASESDRLRDEIITLRAVGDAFSGFADGPELEGGIDAFSRLVEGANKYNDALRPLEERNLRFVESLAKLSTQGAITGESLQNIKIPSILQDAQADIVRRTSAPFRSNTQQVTAFQRQVSTVLTDFSRGTAEAIVQAENLGKVFVNIGEQIETSLIRNAIEQGIKVLGRELGKLISQLGSVGKAIADAFGGVAQTTGNIAGAASGAAGAGGSVAGSAAGIAAGGLAGTITAVSGIATAVFSALQFFQGRRMEQDIGRIEVSNREIASQTIAIQQRLDQWLPYLQNTAYLSSIDGTLTRIYEGLSQLDFSGFGGGKSSQPANFYISNPDPKAVAQEVSRMLRSKSPVFA